jgi:hypothetical protein
MGGGPWVMEIVDRWLLVVGRENPNPVFEHPTSDLGSLLPLSCLPDFQIHFSALSHPRNP